MSKAQNDFNKNISTPNASNAKQGQPSLTGKDAQNPMQSNQGRKNSEVDVDNLVPAKDKNPDDLEIF